MDTAHNVSADTFSESLIAEITDRFSKTNLLGEGGFGSVYKGKLHGTPVAVKRLQEGKSMTGLEKEVAALSRLRHPHILQFMGWCPKARCIVSELMSGGSLQDRLSGPAAKFPPLGWADRIRISAEMASALLFMHKKGIIHRDLKPENVLLDGNLTSKLADMGLARMFDGTIQTRNKAGTFGYIAPEHARKGLLTATADVYALGLIILQLLTGDPNIQNVHGLLEKCGPAHSKLDLKKAAAIFMVKLDPQAGEWGRESTKAALHVALQCVEEERSLRPSLESDVLPRLEKAAKDAKKGKQPESIGSAQTPAPEKEGTKKFWEFWGSGKKEEEELPSEPKMVREYRIKAEQGDSDAQFLLGVCYAIGDGVPKDMERAVLLFMRAAENGCHEAQFNLGVCYENGDVVLQDMKRAVHFYMRAAKNGNFAAQFNLGVCYANGYEVPKDIKRAAQLFMRAAENDHPMAQCSLGRMYMTGSGVTQDMNRGVELLQKAVDQGDSDAQSYLGWCYANGNGVPKDMERAVRLYMCATENGDFDAQINLGASYAMGDGVPKDIERAVQLFMHAAENGYPLAQFNLGILYMTGDGVTQDMNRAVELLQKAADQGYAHAQFQLGVIFANGNGIIQKDMERAVKMLTKAADQSHAEAANMLGKLTRGTGVLGPSV